MSDVSGGPGWWMASDQKWYPPETHPDYLPPPPPAEWPAPPASAYLNAPAPSYPMGEPPSHWPAPSGVLGPRPPLASYGQRLGGWLIDFVIVMAVCVPLSVLTHTFHYVHTTGTFNGLSVKETNFIWSGPGVWLSPLIIVLYGTLMCGRPRGQTLGMMVAGTKVVKASSGSPIGYADALGRALIEEFLAALFFLPWVLDVLFPLWDQRKQTLHDKVSGTVVVQASRS
jgi:uncharacterized RDD family membrane protein YckC